MRRGRHRRDRPWTGRIALRLFDQVAWSAGFFCFNLAATVVLPTQEFALLAVSTSLVFMGVAVSRAWAVGSRIVVATKLRQSVLDAISAASMLRSSILVGCLVLVGIGVATRGSSSSLFLLKMLVLGFGLVLADLPRQGLIYASKFRESLTVSLIYAVLSIAALVMASFLRSDPMWLWTATGFVCAAVGWFFHRRLGRGASLLPARIMRSHAWRMTAESLYTSVASQLALLLLHAFTDPDSTAGYRLSYSLVFAPAFMLLQGISPLLSVHMSGEISRTGRARMRTWFLGPAVTLGAASICGGLGLLVAISPVAPSMIESVVPFLFPVGLGLAGSQVFEFLLLGVRYFVSEHVMHRMRLILVTVDVVVQGLSIWLSGAEGLIFALIFLATLKLLASSGVALAVIRGRFKNRFDPQV